MNWSAIAHKIRLKYDAYRLRKRYFPKDQKKNVITNSCEFIWLRTIALVFGIGFD